MSFRRSALARGARPLLCAAAGLLLGAGDALALEDGKLTLFAEESVSYDNNVLRLPSGADVPAGFSQRFDTYYTTTLGVSFDVPVSRQRFQGGYTWNDVRYDHYSSLDYTGHDGRVAWLWQIGDDASGHLGYSNTAAPPSFAGVSTRPSDILTTQSAYLDGAYMATPSWRLHAGIRQLDQTNSEELSKVDNVNILAGDAAVSYVSSANNAVGVDARVENGHYPNRNFLPGTAIPHAYDQYGAGVLFDWTITAHSHLFGYADYATRRYDQVPQFDFSGLLGRIQYDWKPTGKTTVTAVARREINPYDTTRATFMLVNGVTLTPVLNVTDKIDVSGSLDYSLREYRAEPELACGLVPGTSDRLATATATIAYRPARFVTLTLSGQYQRCTSGLDLANYRTASAALGIRLTF